MAKKRAAKSSKASDRIAEIRAAVEAELEAGAFHGSPEAQAITKLGVEVEAIKRYLDEASGEAE